MTNTLTFLVERAETFHHGAEDTLVAEGMQVPLLVIFGDRSGFIPYTNIASNIVPAEAVTMAVRVLGGTALMLIGLARRATVLLGDDNRPIASIDHRTELSDTDHELWSMAVHLDGPTAVSHITPVYHLEDGIKIGERARVDWSVDAHFEAQRLMDVLAASR